jgi:hypothetical protein
VFVRYATGQTCAPRHQTAQKGTKFDTPDISADDRYVVPFIASNLVANDGNNSCDTDFDGVYDDNCADIFLYDRDTDNDGIYDEAGAVSTKLISISTNGTQGNNASDYFPHISSNGRMIAFTSFASNLVDGDTNNTGDIFIHNRLTYETRLISIY